VKNAGKKNSRRYRSRSLSASSTDSYSSGKEGSIKSLNTLSKNPRLLRTFSHTRVHSSKKILVGKNRRMSSPPISEKFDLNFLSFFGFNLLRFFLLLPIDSAHLMFFFISKKKGQSSLVVRHHLLQCPSYCETSGPVFILFP
jgi:hypothetical protein